MGYLGDVAQDGANAACGQGRGRANWPGRFGPGRTTVVGAKQAGEVQACLDREVGVGAAGGGFAFDQGRRRRDRCP
jgi:hypothetical protein